MNYKIFTAIILFTILAAALEFFFLNFGIIFCLLVIIMIMLFKQTPSINTQKPNTIENKAAVFLLKKANDSLNTANKIFSEIGGNTEEFELK